MPVMVRVAYLSRGLMLVMRIDACHDAVRKIDKHADACLMLVMSSGACKNSYVKTVNDIEICHLYATQAGL